MVVMVVGFIVTALAIDLVLVLLVNQYKNVMIIYWNVSNMLYGLLNILLIFIINFQPHPYVRYCFLKCCYYVQDQSKANQEIVQNSLKETAYSSQKFNQNIQKMNKSHCEVVKNIRDWFIGSFYSFVSIFLILIITISIIMFCLKIKKQKADQFSRKQLFRKKKSQVEVSNVIIQQRIQRDH